MSTTASILCRALSLMSLTGAHQGEECHLEADAPAGKKSKATKKKKAAKPVNLRALPMWVLTTDLKKHRNVAIAHEKKWVIGNADTITGDIANEPSSKHHHKKGRLARGSRWATRST